MNLKKRRWLSRGGEYKGTLWVVLTEKDGWQPWKVDLSKLSQAFLAYDNNVRLRAFREEKMNK